MTTSQAGFIGSAPGLSSCESECTAGTFSNDARTQCVVCAPGKYSDAGAATCGLCSEGSATPTEAPRDRCNACEAGEFATPGETEGCQPCSAGRWSSSTNVGGSCQACREGRFGDVGPKTSEDLHCSKCIKGKFSSAIGAVGAVMCSDCPGGKQSEIEANPTISNCHNCEAGQFSSPGAENCSPCGTGTISSSPGSASCEVCDAGTFANLDTSDTLTRANMDCLECPDGLRCINGVIADCGGDGGVGGADGISCTLCESGKIKSGDECVSCGGGKFSRTGWKACQSCVRGRYSNLDRSDCALCSSGKWSSAVGALDRSVCTDCAQGKFNGAGGSSSEEACYLQVPPPLAFPLRDSSLLDSS